MTHELKIWPQYYEPVVSGDKTFEIRVNDRGFQRGDEVTFYEWNPTLKDYTGAISKTFRIGYVLPIDHERVVFSLVKP